MSPTLKILIKTLVIPFYRQNGGLFIFLIIIMFGIIGKVDGADTLEYHYALIRGLLSNILFFLLVLFAWFLYARKCMRFVLRSFQKQDYFFLNILSLTKFKTLYFQLLFVQLLVFLPVLLYSIAIISIALYKAWYSSAIIVLLFNVFICLASAYWYQHYLRNPEKSQQTRLIRIYQVVSFHNLYYPILIRHLVTRLKFLFLGFKLYNCIILYLLIRNLTSVDYDIAMPFIFYSFGLLGQGVLIHQLREFEEQNLIFYRGLPISLVKRFSGYAILYFIILVPEIITIGLLTSKFLLLKDSITFILSSYSILLLLNSILFIYPYKMLDYLKLSFVLFCIIYIALLINLFYWLPAVIFSLAAYLFLMGYYNYEKYSNR